MEHIFISKPCSENWNAMTPTQKGAFCAQCAKEVTDFTTLTHNEVKLTLSRQREGELCGRFREPQLAVLNAEIDSFSFRSTKSFQSALVFSLIVVFGMTLFSCSNEQQQQEVEQVRAQAKNALKELSLATTSHNEEMREAAGSEIKQVVLRELIPPEEVPIEMLLEEYVISTEKTLEEYEAIHEYHILGGVGYRDFVTIEAIPEMITNVELDANGIPYPTQFDALVYPNPTNGPATFKLDIPIKQRFVISVFNMNGQLVQSLTDQEIDRGTFRQEIDLSDQPTGMYLVTIMSNDFKKTLRVSKL